MEWSSRLKPCGIVLWIVWFLFVFMSWPNSAPIKLSIIIATNCLRRILFEFVMLLTASGGDCSCSCLGSVEVVEEMLEVELICDCISCCCCCCCGEFCWLSDCCTFSWFRSSKSLSRLDKCGSHVLISKARPVGPTRFSSLFNSACAASRIFCDQICLRILKKNLYSNSNELPHRMDPSIWVPMFPNWLPW